MNMTSYPESQPARTVGVVFLLIGCLVAGAIGLALYFFVALLSRKELGILTILILLFPPVYMTTMLIVAIKRMPRKVAKYWLVGANSVGFGWIVWILAPWGVSEYIAAIVVGMTSSSLVSWALHRTPETVNRGGF
jgi:Na+/melibiose symporter-like transporter